MKIQGQQSGRFRRGFSLIELIGVLAILAILIGLLLPKMFDAISQAQLTTAVSIILGIKNTTMSYYGQYGRFGDANGNVITSTNDPAALNWGTQVLLKAGYLENPVRTPIASSAVVRLRPVLAANTAPTAANSAYNIDGFDPLLNDAQDGRWVVEVFLTDVAVEQAEELNLRIDRQPVTLDADGDEQGRVKLIPKPGVCDVLVYIAHR